MATLPNVSSPLARLLSSPPTSNTTPFYAFATYHVSRNRKFIIIGISALFIVFFIYLQDTASFSAPEVWKQSKPPPFLDNVGVPVTHTVTHTVSSPTVTVTHTVALPSPSPTHALTSSHPISYVLIAWSEDAAVEGTVLMKSIIMYSSRPSEFHIICDEAGEKSIRASLALLHSLLHTVNVHFYQPSWSSMMDRIEREGSIRTDHSAGIPGLMKLFLHEILPASVNKVIYLDTDAILISDPLLLWNLFERLKPSTAIVMPSHPDQHSEEWHHANRICSCIMLLDLDKLRQMRMMDSSIYREDHSGRYPPALGPSAFKAMYGEPTGEGHRYDNVRLGDQGYWWAIVHHNPQLFESLSYDWEISSCLVDMYSTGLGAPLMTESEEMTHQGHVIDTPQYGTVVLPKLLHFNCLHNTARYFEWAGWSDVNDSLTKRWGPAVSYHVGYKWIWLNQARRKNGPVITTQAVLFADEEFAKHNQHP